MQYLGMTVVVEQSISTTPLLLFEMYWTIHASGFRGH